MHMHIRMTACVLHCAIKYKFFYINQDTYINTYVYMGHFILIILFTYQQFEYEILHRPSLVVRVLTFKDIRLEFKSQTGHLQQNEI